MSIQDGAKIGPFILTFLLYVADYKGKIIQYLCDPVHTHRKEAL